jgi:hypothetical protein
MSNITLRQLFYTILYIIAIYSLLNFYFIENNFKKIFGIIGHILLTYFLLIYLYKSKFKS